MKYMNNNYTFLNPYNFVRYLDEGNQDDIPEIKLLGRCTPPPHDRYIGLTGKITCELEAVTPIFISDSEFVEEYLLSIEDANGELVKELNDSKINDRLKALFQTNKILISENISIKKENSNKWILEDKDNKNLYFIEKDDSKLNIFPYSHKSYRFFRLKNENGEEQYAIPSTSLRGMLRSLFEASTNSCFSVFEDRRLSYRDVQKARAMKPAIVRSLPNNSSKGKMEICESARIPFNLLQQGNWICGEEANAILGRASKVIQISKKPLNDSKKGWVKITGNNIPNKKNEYFFYPMNNKMEIEFDLNRMDDYNNILAEQIADGFSTEYQTPTLEVGNLVYVEVSQTRVIHNIALVKVPRLLYQNSIDDLLPDYLYCCSDYDQLCPACRLFGWVHQQPPNEKAKTAYAGRIRISHAQLLNDKVTMEEFPLAIQSTPKPTTTFFYLFNNGEPDFNVTYDMDGAHLRGRKHYLHQSEAKEQEYKRAGNIKDDQNRTIRDTLKSGATFKFTVEFENLAPVEFGALLWSIEMENDMFHKIGLGKPLGFGSVKLSIINISTLNIKERYGSYSNNGWNIITDLEKMKGIFINKFRDSMKIKHNKNFNELINIMDLKAILSEHALAVHYPRTLREPDPDGRNFEWFVQNKRNRRFGQKPLKKAPEDTSGFPLQF